MVRHKTRWLLVKLEVPATLRTASSNDDNQEVATGLPSRKDLSTAIRQNIVHHLGVAAEGMASDTQVRFWDPTTRLLLIRVPRADCGRIRASLTVWTHLSTNNNTLLVASILSVNGSARTAKRSAMGHIQRYYRGRWLQQRASRKMIDKECRKLQELITTIQGID